MIEAMKQALEAMRYELKIDWTDPDESLLAADKLRDAIISLEKAIEQAEKQEPVAWMNKKANVFAQYKEGAENFGCDIPLYTHPQPKREWQGLTDEDFYGATKLQIYAMKYAEAKLKEKNT